MTGHKSVLRNRIACALSMSLALVCGQVLAEPGITDTKILIGQTAGFTGPAGEQVKEMTRGAQLYLDAVNRAGGVYGRRIELISEDDGFDANVSKQRAHTLLTDKQVFALFLSRGTPNTEAIMSEAHAVGAPMVAPSTGASIFFDRPDPLVFVVRAKYQTEIAELVHHFETLGLKRLALVNVNDSFGKDTEAGFTTATQHLPPSTHQIVTVDRLEAEHRDSDRGDREIRAQCRDPGLRGHHRASTGRSAHQARHRVADGNAVEQFEHGLRAIAGEHGARHDGNAGDAVAGARDLADRP